MPSVDVRELRELVEYMSSDSQGDGIPSLAFEVWHFHGREILELIEAAVEEYNRNGLHGRIGDATEPFIEGGDADGGGPQQENPTDVTGGGEAGMCPQCGEWCGRGSGCEWCSEFAQESGWNDVREASPPDPEDVIYRCRRCKDISRTMNCERSCRDTESAKHVWQRFVPDQESESS